MKKATDAFVAGLAALIDEHKIGVLDVPTTVGQALNAVQDVSSTNSLKWSLLGMAADELVRKDVAGTLKKMAVKYDRKHLNYNDLDDDIWGRYVKWPIECLECSAIVAKLGSRKTPPPVAECPRCGGTGKDPEFFEEAWVVVADMHGNGFAFMVYENYGGLTVHFRELPYNKGDRVRKNTLEALAVSLQCDCYDSKEPLLACRDSRDEGFVLSITIEKDDGRIDGDASDRFAWMMSLVNEHFPCLLGEEEIGDVT